MNASAAQRVQSSVYGGIQLQIIAQWAYTSVGAGYVQITVNGTSPMTNRTAMVGDILGFQGAFIAKEISTDGTADYRCSSPSIVSNAFTCTVANLSANGTNFRHLLQTTIVQAIQIAPIISYDDVGNFNVQGTLTQRNVSSFSTSTILPVIYGINWIEVVGPASVSANVRVIFTANVYPPSKQFYARKKLFNPLFFARCHGHDIPLDSQWNQLPEFHFEHAEYFLSSNRNEHHRLSSTKSTLDEIELDVDLGSRYRQQFDIARWQCHQCLHLATLAGGSISTANGFGK